jgi:hypothetical protein
MKSLFSRNLLPDIKATLARFPLVNLCAFLTFVLIRYLIHEEHTGTEWVAKLLVLLVLGIPGFLAAGLFEEANQIRIRRRWYTKLLLMAWLVWQYFSLPDDAKNPDILALLIKFTVLGLLVSFSGYLNNRLVSFFWQFNHRLVLRLLQTGLYAGVLFLGLSGAILAMEHLFQIKWPFLIYADVLLFIGLVFGSLFFTAGIPQSLDAPVFYPPGLKAFVQSVLVPLVLLYFLILYGYGIKILWLWSLPSGWVSYLVLASGISSVLTYMLVWPISNSGDSHWTGIFKTWIFKALLPLVGLMGLALYQRVNQYGWTEDRLLVAVFSVFLFLNSLYLGFSKSKNIKVIPVSLALLLVLSMTGPWNIFRISAQSQVERLKEILVKNQLLENGRWVPSKRNDITEEDLDQIESKLSYLYDHFGCAPFENGLIDKKQLSQWKKLETDKQDFKSVVLEKMKLNTKNQIYLNSGDNGEIKYAQFGNPASGFLIRPDLEMMEFGKENYLLADSTERVFSKLLNTDITFRLHKKSNLILEFNGQMQAFDLHSFANQGWEQQEEKAAPAAELESKKCGLNLKIQITRIEIQQKAENKEVTGICGRIFISVK